MAAVLALIGIILGTGVAPASLAAVTATQWAVVGLAVAKGVPTAIKLEQQLNAVVQSPEFKQWAAANGDIAIQLQPGISRER